MGAYVAPRLVRVGEISGPHSRLQRERRRYATQVAYEQEHDFTDDDF
jgi:hypothetical protein